MLTMMVLDLANRPYHDCFVNCYDSFVMFSAKLKPPSCIYSVSNFQLLGPTDYHSRHGALVHVA